MDVCFTGTRQGMTDKQKRAVKELLEQAKPNRVCHGCAIGADREFHVMTEPGTRDLYPSNPSQSAWALSVAVEGDRVCAEMPPLVRNREMVDQSVLIIAAPKTSAEELRSGTWATVRYARQREVERDWMVVYVLEP